MALPQIPLPTDSVEIEGFRVEYRALSRNAALKLQSYKGREDEAEIFIVAQACGVSEDDARAWLSSVSVDAVTPLIDGILTLSGLTNEDPKA